MMFNRSKFRLRKLTEQDLRQVLRWRNSERVRSNMLTDHLISFKEHQIWFEKLRKDHCNVCMIFEMEAIPYGVANFMNINWEEGSCEWGFYLGKTKRQRGMGSVLGYLSLEHAFEQLGLSKVYGKVLNFNIGSIRLFDSFNFIREGSTRRCRNDRYVTVFLFNMVKEQWDKQKESIYYRIFYKGD